MQAEVGAQDHRHPVRITTLGKERAGDLRQSRGRTPGRQGSQGRPQSPPTGSPSSQHRSLGREAELLSGEADGDVVDEDAGAGAGGA